MDSVIFHPAAGIDADAVAQAQATLRRRIPSAFVGRGHLKRFKAKEMLAGQIAQQNFSGNRGAAHTRRVLAFR